MSVFNYLIAGCIVLFCAVCLCAGLLLFVCLASCLLLIAVAKANIVRVAVTLVVADCSYSSCACLVCLMVSDMCRSNAVDVFELFLSI